MTFAEHAKRIRQIAFELEKADYGLALPRDYERVQHLRKALAEAQEEARLAYLASMVLSS
jgi:hypothetical protein